MILQRQFYIIEHAAAEGHVPPILQVPRWVYAHHEAKPSPQHPVLRHSRYPMASHSFAPGHVQVQRMPT
jgi:hypothetical protein